MHNKQNNLSRKAGVLLHISSLPSGNFGDDAFKFIDFLADIGAHVWQTLPLNMPHDDGSPYQCLSAHAGNPAFISLEKLVESGWIASDEAGLGTTQAVSIAYNRFYKQLADQRAFARFCRKHAHWLNDFSLFLALRNHFNHASWVDWPAAYKNRESKALKQFKNDFLAEIDLIKFTQFIFFNQWSNLKKHAQFNQIKLFGDLPIFVAYDSADVWANRALFKLNKRGQMTVVAGVPPDYFSETGQHWGNPHYNWRSMQQDGFKWWLARIRTQKQLFDIVRIDHFRGFEAAWEIPARDQSAINGQWRRALGNALLKAVTKTFPSLQLVAEDLGIITPKVEALRQKYKLPGMKILQFAFGGDDSNPYLPHNIVENSVAYTGTHDNDTTLGWYQNLDDHSKNHLHQVLKNSAPAMPQDLIALVLDSKANLAIIPMQDILALDDAHRMNTPGTIVGNWQWRFTWDMLNTTAQDGIKNAIIHSNRS